MNRLQAAPGFRPFGKLRNRDMMLTKNILKKRTGPFLTLAYAISLIIAIFLIGCGSVEVQTFEQLSPVELTSEPNKNPQTLAPSLLVTPGSTASTNEIPVTLTKTAVDANKLDESSNSNSTQEEEPSSSHPDLSETGSEERVFDLQSVANIAEAKEQIIGPILGINYAIDDAGNETIYLIDVGGSQMFAWDVGLARFRLSNIGDQCAVQAATRNPDMGMTIYTYDFVTEVEKEFALTAEIFSQHINFKHVELNKSKEFAAFISLDGDLGYATYTIQNLEILRLINDQPFLVEELETNGGVLSYSWSHDGQKIAFNDFDSQQIRQLYVYDIYSGERRQLTSFTDPGSPVGEPLGNFIGQPIWSDDDRYLAFKEGVTDENGKFNQSLLISDLDGNITKVTDSMANLRALEIMGWVHDSRSLAYYTRQDDKQMYLIIYSPGEDAITRTYPERGIEGIIPSLTLLALINDGQWLAEDDQGILYQFDENLQGATVLNGVGLPQNQLLLTANQTRSGMSGIIGSIEGWTIIEECR